jgi:hypothetical protein
MHKLTRLFALVALLTVSLSAPAHATMKEWLNVCSSGSFITCASVRLWVSGTTVTIEVRNTSSGTAANSATGYRGAVFYSIGLRNIPSAVMRSGTFFSMNGPTYTAKAGTTWFATGTNGGGQITVSDGTPSGAYANGIASNCATSAGGTNLIPTNTKEWMTPTCGTTNVTNPTLNAGWVDINFFTNQTWDPTLDNTSLVINAIDEQGRLYQIDYALGTTPEPFVVLLLGTGLAAIGGAQLRRRRRVSRDAIG